MLCDGRSYTAYRDLCGCYDMDHFKLHIDHVQADPFAAPSRLRVCVPAPKAGYPQHAYSSQGRAIALCTYLIDEFAAHARRWNSSTASNDKSPIAIAEAGQQLLERNAMQVPKTVLKRVSLALSGSRTKSCGRTGRAAPLRMRSTSLKTRSYLRRTSRCYRTVYRYERRCMHARTAKEQNLIAFIADGSTRPATRE